MDRGANDGRFAVAEAARAEAGEKRKGASRETRRVQEPAFLSAAAAAIYEKIDQTMAAATGAPLDADAEADDCSDEDAAAGGSSGNGKTLIHNGVKSYRRPRGISSRFRGVTKHKRTGRWESHCWDAGKQLYLGGFGDEESAGRAYDIVVLKLRGKASETNFPISDYTDVLKGVGNVSRDELIALLRRKSKGNSRNTSRFRGVTKHKGGRWEARMAPQHLGKKYQYLGLYESEETAARAYDAALVRYNGVAATTNFPIEQYPAEMAEWNRNNDQQQSAQEKLPQQAQHVLPQQLPPAVIQPARDAAALLTVSKRPASQNDVPESSTAAKLALVEAGVEAN